ncbi:MAG: response regulator [Myxococcota bacterium]
MGINQQPEALESAAKSIAENRPRHRSVLVVESDPDLQWHLARMLTVDGNRVVGTSSGDGALTVVEEWQADLALVAAHLPGMPGLEVAKRLHALNPNLVVILMGGEQQAEPAPKVGTHVSAVLPKPFRFDALRALIESLQLAPAPAE